MCPRTLKNRNAPTALPFRHVRLSVKVAQNRALCEMWENQWPVLSLTLKSVDVRDFTDAFEMLTAVIAAIYMEHIIYLTVIKSPHGKRTVLAIGQENSITRGNYKQFGIFNTDVDDLLWKTGSIVY